MTALAVAEPEDFEDAEPGPGLGLLRPPLLFGRGPGSGHWPAPEPPRLCPSARSLRTAP